MLFNSFEFFLVFLPITLVVFFIIGGRNHHRIAIAWLVSCSLFFYAWWNPNYLYVLVSSLLFNYSLGVMLSGRRKNKLLLFFGISTNLFFLGYFKYTNFLIENINFVSGTNFNFTYIILPLAISFFTFQQIAYLVDAYRGEVREYNFLHYSLFVTFFPQLIAGPIVHHKEMLPQFSLNTTYKFKIENINIGLTIFAIGLFKKVVLADGIAQFSTPVFNAADAGEAVTFFEAWGGALSYTLQLYFDFSGYADMAIGLAKMFGIDLPINFNSPYKSVNIIEFWRRWHMTLSKFLKDYLYISFGGNRKGSKNVNLMATMLLGGLWHGASFNFIIWGGLHGLYLIINHSWQKLRVKLFKHDLNDSSIIGTTFSTALTFLVVVVAWVFFRAESLEGAIRLIEGMAGFNGISLPTKAEPLLKNILSTDLIVFQGLGSFASVIGFAWIISLLTLTFFMPNSAELVSKCRGVITSKRADGLSLYKLLVGMLIGFLLFASIKLMLTANDTEFLYFNF